jgi:diadenosine tetraphosphate (Ap4A) HIT family hydrolase
MAECPFCSIALGLSDTKPIAESEHSVAFEDLYPLSPGHTLIAPRRHEADLFQLEKEERADAWVLVDTVQQLLVERLNPDGFNIGVNVSETAGQTVEHAHIHLVPRFHGDVEDPRGGIRWVIPDKAPYWN